MAIRPFLAMTPAEIRAAKVLPDKIAWMACHFSPYSTGLSNLPRALPPGSMVILDDITPIHGHDPQAIAAQLLQRLDTMKCSAVLLDFQRPDFGESADLAGYLTQALPCPVGVSAVYAQTLDGPVFLPPVPLDVGLADYISPWQGREIWLEAALDSQAITLTAQGASAAPIAPGHAFPEGFSDETLHCRYSAAVSQDCARFTLWRTPEDLTALLTEAESLGVTTAVGLYQELGRLELAPENP